MKLYYTKTSPYARLVRVLILEKGLADAVTLIEAKTRTPASPYYRINPSGRVPFLERPGEPSLEDSQLITAVLDGLGSGPRLTRPPETDGWRYGRLEAYARSMLDGLSVYLREMRRPESERSPTILDHERDRARRLADFWEVEVASALMQGEPNIAQLLLVIALDTARMAGIRDLETGRPALQAFAGRLRARPSLAATAPA